MAHVRRGDLSLLQLDPVVESELAGEKHVLTPIPNNDKRGAIMAGASRPWSPQPARRFPVCHLLGASSLPFVLVLGFGSILPAGERTVSSRSYSTPNHGSLELAVTNIWKDSVAQPPRGLSPTITFSPPAGDEFQVLVTALWSATAEPGFNTPENVRVSVRRQGEKLLSQAAEKTLVLEELRGEEAVGYFYTLTDRAPKPGEYPYMSQGVMGVGDLLITFIIL